MRQFIINSATRPARAPIAVEPPSGFTKGLPTAKRTDVGEGDIPPEVRGRNFFPYKPIHLEASPPRPNLANIVNAVQRVLSSGAYQGAIWTQGSPRMLW